ncbi:MAG: tRNA epoxyqueuosine(34) reductase QueG [Candidatus Neomarinimicrobiota bacterium]
MINTAQVIRFAIESGFVRAGVSQPTMASKYVTAFKEWTDAGHSAGMHWMYKYYDFPAYLQARFGWAKSVLVVVDNYLQPGNWPVEFPKVARYAWGADYHRVVERKLKRICRIIREMEPATIARTYVDAGPVMQKAFAAQAGLGWIGKNNLLIVPEIGSYCFIGIVFLSIDLEFNEPMAGRCGGCRRCLAACPNGALTDGYKLDARRCTAYLTIEKEGEFSAAEKELLHGWLYGCDLCQEACPYNQTWTQPGDQQYGESFASLGRSLNDWLKLTESEFLTLFRNHPVKRLGYDLWRRNLHALMK